MTLREVPARKLKKFNQTSRLLATMDFFGQSESAKTHSGQCQTSNIQVLPSGHIRPVLMFFFSGSNWLKQNRDTKNNPDLSCYISRSQFQRLKQPKIIKTVATSASARLTMDTWDTGKVCLIQQSLCWCVLNMYIYINMADHTHIYIYM